MDDARAAMLEGLNVFRALEAWGAKLYACWAEHESDAALRAGHLVIAEREANHARILAERIRALGGEPGPACVDDVLEAQLAELQNVAGFVAQLDGLKRVNQRDAERMAGCQAALRRGFEAAKTADPETHRLWAQLYSEERVSGDWYRGTYSALTGKRADRPGVPALAPGQVIRRAETVTVTAGEPAACAVVDGV
jgi:rubrerythrin